LDTFLKQVPLKYQDARLEYCEDHPSAFLDYAYEWALKPKSVILYGSYGTGKTYFAFAMIREMFRSCPKKLWPRYFTSSELDARFLNAAKSDKGDREELMDRAHEDILFIDDVGREMKTDRFKRQYFELFNIRYSKELPTIITTNYTLDKLSEIIDPSIASRIQEWDIIEFKGGDRRANKCIA
jgi:DNA replication protein DnaC